MSLRLIILRPRETKVKISITSIKIQLNNWNVLTHFAVILSWTFFGSFLTKLFTNFTLWILIYMLWKHNSWNFTLNLKHGQTSPVAFYESHSHSGLLKQKEHLGVAGDSGWWSGPPHMLVKLSWWCTYAAGGKMHAFIFSCFRAEMWPLALLQKLPHCMGLLIVLK